MSCFHSLHPTIAALPTARTWYRWPRPCFSWGWRATTVPHFNPILPSPVSATPSQEGPGGTSEVKVWPRLAQLAVWDLSYHSSPTRLGPRWVSFVMVSTPILHPQLGSQPWCFPPGKVLAPFSSCHQEGVASMNVGALAALRLHPNMAARCSQGDPDLGVPKDPPAP